MRASTVHEIKSELNSLKQNDLVDICLRLARFKKENKELMTYLLFEAHNEQGYVDSVKKEIDILFSEINMANLYWAKKSLRKIVRIINKYCRYSGSKTTEIELRIYFCQLLNESGIPFHQNTVISNLYHSQIKKMFSILDTLHEDLQYDYKREIEKLAGK
ncbi:MAG: hypothetical protein JNL23_02655 [Chitinophagaceae bacterium]|nr:hypothetical protein [Chitinophagaceae bacterium]